MWESSYYIRGIKVSHETIRSWCYKFGKEFEKVIKKKQKKITDEWHLDEMIMKLNGEYFIHKLKSYIKPIKEMRRLT